VTAGGRIEYTAVVATGGVDEKLGDYPTDGPPVRCDSQLGNRPNGCVLPDATPVFGIDEGLHPTVARHVRAAQRSGLVGLNYPLTRITDEAQIDANRNTACPGFIPRPIGSSCDEYPFASTAEGAAMFGDEAGRSFSWCNRFDLPQNQKGAAGWSACMVDEDDNFGAGVDLSVFYGDNRVLGGDNFFVEID
jgi:hypothetical protein